MQYQIDQLKLQKKKKLVIIMLYLILNKKRKKCKLCSLRNRLTEILRKLLIIFNTIGKGAPATGGFFTTLRVFREL